MSETSSDNWIDGQYEAGADPQPSAEAVAGSAAPDTGETDSSVPEGPGVGMTVGEPSSFEPEEDSSGTPG